MRYLITGASGMVGQRITTFAQQQGDEVVPLVRRVAQPGERRWNPMTGEIDSNVFEGIDAVIHLAGENIGEGRWTTAKKKRILESRVKGTQLLANALAGSNHKPPLICASAIGVYGDRGSELLTEQSAAGSGFLADVCRDWEAAADPARAAGVRVVHNRLGIVLSAQGGALASMLMPFRMCFGGRMGSGTQYWSCISLDDAASAFLFAARESTLAGPVNVVSPQPVTNADFTTVLGRVLRRPTIFPIPAFAARLVLGEMADALILSSARVLPGVLQNHSFKFAHADLESALRAGIK